MMIKQLKPDQILVYEPSLNLILLNSYVVLVSNDLFAQQLEHFQTHDEQCQLKQQQSSNNDLEQSVSNFIFLALAYEGRWQVLSIAISCSHDGQRTHYS